eukprot:558566-Rhodomonas_salina.1
MRCCACPFARAVCTMLHTRVYTVLQTHVCVHSAARTRVHTVLLEPLVSIICSLILARDAPTPIVSQVLLTEDGVPPSGVCPLKPGEMSGADESQRDRRYPIFLGPAYQMSGTDVSQSDAVTHMKVELSRVGRWLWFYFCFCFSRPASYAGSLSLSLRLFMRLRLRRLLSFSSVLCLLLSLSAFSLSLLLNLTLLIVLVLTGPGPACLRSRT